MTAHDFTDLFHAHVQTLRASLQSSRGALKHPTQKGGVVEDSFRNFLKTILPKRFGVTEGTIYAVDGSHSPQCDIIIYDATSAPIIFDKNDTRLIPNECVYGVIEIKSTLTRKHLQDARGLCQQLRNMPKTAYSVKRNRFFLTTPPITYFPTLVYLIGVESNSFNSISEEFSAQYAESTSWKDLINLIFCLESGVLCYTNPPQEFLPAGLGTFPISGSRPTAAHGDKLGILGFCLLLDLILAGKSCEEFNFLQYATHMNFSTKIL